MSEEKVLTENAWQLCECEEEMGYDVPFATLSWARWLDIQAKMTQCLARYQRAIEHRQAQVALLVIGEMQQLFAELHTEACGWIGVKEPE